MKIQVRNLMVQHTNVSSECFEISKNSEIFVYFYDKSRGVPVVSDENGWRRNLADSIVILKGKAFNEQELTFNVVTEEIESLINQLKGNPFNIVIISEIAVITGTCKIIKDDVTENDSLRIRKFAPAKPGVQQQLRR